MPKGELLASGRDAITRPPEQAGWTPRVVAFGSHLAASDGFRLFFAVAVFGAAIWLLRRELGAASLASIVAGFRATPIWAIGIAIGATVASYLGLAGSEWWALACIGRKLSGWKIGLVTLVSYALSNGLGFSLATGGASRLRFYRAWGLGGSEIAAVTVLAGAAVTLSGAVAAGAALLLVPGIPAPLRLLAIGLVVPAWLWFGRLPTSVRILPKVTLTNPNLQLRLAAFAAAILDWILSGLALFVLLPNASADQFAGFLAVFILGSVVSAVSGIPGGLGVFEAVVMALSHSFAQSHDTVAALVLYRVIYSIGPLTLTAVGLAASQVHRLATTPLADEAKVAAKTLAPPVLAGLTFSLGAALVLTAANVPFLETMAPALVAPLPAAGLFSSLLGALLLVLAVALWRRQEAGYALGLVLFVAGAGFEAWRGFGAASATPLIILALSLAPCRFAFKRRSAAARDATSRPWIVAISLCGLSAVTLALSIRHGLGGAELPWWRLLRPDTAGPLGVAAGLSCVGLIAGMWRLLSPSQTDGERAGAEERARAQSIIETTRAVATDAYLALLGDKSFVFSPSGRSFVMYRTIGAHWIAMGDPVGPDDDRAAAVDAFVDAATEAQAVPGFYAIGQASLLSLIDTGFLITKVGESAFVELATFNLAGKAREKLRHAANHARKAALGFQVLAADDLATPWEELRAVSDAWLAAHKGGELSFSLGRFDIDYLRHFPIALLRGPQGVAAFANLLTTPDGRCVAVDLMRHRPDGPHAVMDALFVEIMGWARANGYAEFELGMAPLAGLEITSVAPLSRRLEALVYRSAERFYGFKGLRAYKQKFDPVWRPVFLATAAGLGPVAALADVGRLTRRKIVSRPAFTHGGSRRQH